MVTYALLRDIFAPMPVIRILPEYLANQIAAGEVVQRPESVVKELVENAIDAGATAVSIVVRNAGKQMIHVIDNGKGMSADDLALSIVRHATSKIQTEADLHNILTLGFRGEALASIAAVADVEIRTCSKAAQADDSETRANELSNTGWVLTARPGEQFEIRQSSTAPGTQVIVRNLFYNVPARRKFLKSDLTEFRHVSETMQRLALSRPDVRFTFYDADALVFDVRPSTLLERVREILALDTDKKLVETSMTEGALAVQGFVGLPTTVRQSRSGQFLFLNGRPIVSRQLAHAVLTAYEHLLDAGSHPVFVLHLTVDPAKVDVNVHPQKNEVKFDDERHAYLLVQAAVSKALRSADVLPSFLADLPLAQQPLQSLPTTPEGGITYLNRLTGEIVQRIPSTGIPSSIINSTPSRDVTQNLFPSAPEAPALPVMQVDFRYIVTATADGMLVIDQRAAHKRILYERVVVKGAQAKRSEQALLFSVTIAMAPTDVLLAKEYLAEFLALGFNLEVVNSTTVIVHSVPSDVQPGSEEHVLLQIIDGLKATGSSKAEDKLLRMAAIYASKQAITRGERLTTSEMATLVTNLLHCSMPHLTPDGKPTLFLVPFDEIASRLR